jgi:hypothetical protein
MTSLADKIVVIGASLDAAGVPHGFGGALALAWCTQRARGTIDIDVNLFVDATNAPAALAALPVEVRRTDEDVRAAAETGQVRLWWDSTPVDVFLDVTDFHREAAGRVRHEPFNGAQVPFLGCSDLAVFKAFFDRTKDWADLEEMAAAGSLDVERVLGVLVRYLGADDHRVARLREVAGPAA